MLWKKLGLDNTWNDTGFPMIYRGPVVVVGPHAKFKDIENLRGALHDLLTGMARAYVCALHCCVLLSVSGCSQAQPCFRARFPTPASRQLQ